MMCAIWYHLYNFRKCNKHPWRSVTFGKVTGFSCNFTKSITPPWVFFMFFKLVPNRTKSSKGSHLEVLMVSKNSETSCQSAMDR